MNNMRSWNDKNYKIGFPKAKGDVSNMGFPCYADTKYDGELNFIIIKDGEMEMVNKDKYGRHRTDFPVIDELKIQDLPDNTILCGELYYGDNIYDFLRNRDNENLQFAIFDMWEFKEIKDNYYIPKHKMSYQDRRQKLEETITDDEHIHLSEVSLVQSKHELERAKTTAINKGYEGIIAKISGSIWVDGDSKAWCKMKKEQTADLVVIGYSRKAKHLSLHLGYKVNGKWVGLCGCGSGITFADKMIWKAKLEKDKLPNNKQIDKKNFLVEPKYVVEVSFQEITKINGLVSGLRHPVYKRFRDDKTIGEVSFK